MATDHIYSLGLTGTDRVANAFGDGVPRGSICLLEAPDGGGKSVISQRFAYGFCEEDTYVSYVTPEFTSREFINQMSSLSYPVRDHLLDQQLLFLHADVDTQQYLPDATGQLDAETARHHQRELISRLMNADTMWRADVIILDGFGALLRHDPRMDAVMAADEGDHAMQNFLSFLQNLTANQKTIILTVNPNAVDDATLRPIRQTADVYFEIAINEVGQDRRRAVKVHRYGNRDERVDDTINFTVQAGTGMTIVSRTVA